MVKYFVLTRILLLFNVVQIKYSHIIQQLQLASLPDKSVTYSATCCFLSWVSSLQQIVNFSEFLSYLVIFLTKII